MNLELTQSTLIGISYLVAVPYVLWRMFARYSKTSLDGVIGTTPGFDTIIFVCIAPVWMVLDLIITWIMKIIEYRKSMKENKTIE